jgi:hypothetical protein
MTGGVMEPSSTGGTVDGTEEYKAFLRLFHSGLFLISVDRSKALSYVHAVPQHKAEFTYLGVVGIGLWITTLVLAIMLLWVWCLLALIFSVGWSKNIGDTACERLRGDVLKDWRVFEKADELKMVRLVPNPKKTS